MSTCLLESLESNNVSTGRHASLNPLPEAFKLSSFQTAFADCRERKRAQFEELQQRVSQLMKDNDKLTAELEDKTRRLEDANEELATLSNSASESAITHQSFKTSGTENDRSVLISSSTLITSCDGMGIKTLNHKHVKDYSSG